MLEVPLRQSQIEAAKKLHHKLLDWTTAENALDELQRTLPCYSLEIVLVKAAALDRLYNVKVRGQAIHRLARHIAEVMPMPPQDPVAVVQAIIAAPGVEKEYKCFASKFAHFFIDPQRFPIYDSFSRKQTAYHLGRPIPESYGAFYRGVCDLIRRSGVSACFRELDHYLWLAGKYRAFRKGQRNIGAELLALLQNRSSEVKALREALVAPE